MPEPNSIHVACGRWGEQLHLKKKSSTWYLVGCEVICVSNLQKSIYGPQYYFNQAFWIREIEDVQYPKAYNCHIRLRLETQVPDQQEALRLMDLRYEISDDARVDRLVNLLSTWITPLIHDGSSVSGLAALRTSGAFTHAAITGPALSVLGAIAT